MQTINSGNTARHIWNGMLLCSIAMAVVSCGGARVGNGPATKGVRTYQVRGVVRELKPDGQSVVIRHEKIPGYMEAMSMPFQARATNELAGIMPGDEVSFRLSVTEAESWIDHVKRTGK